MKKLFTATALATTAFASTASAQNVETDSDLSFLALSEGTMSAQVNSACAPVIDSVVSGAEISIDTIADCSTATDKARLFFYNKVAPGVGITGRTSVLERCVNAFQNTPSAQEKGSDRYKVEASFVMAQKGHSCVSNLIQSDGINQDMFRPVRASLAYMNSTNNLFFCLGAASGQKFLDTYAQNDPDGFQGQRRLTKDDGDECRRIYAGFKL